MSTTAPPSTHLTKHSRIELEIWSAAFVHNNCYANYNQMRSPKDWRQHVDQLKARAKDVVRTGLPVTQLSLLRSRVLQPPKLPKRKCVKAPQTRTATYEQAEDVYLKTLVLLTPLLTKPMAKPIEAWRQFHEKATAWIVERRERLEDEGYERVLDYSEFPMMDSLLPAEPLWDEEEPETEEDSESELDALTDADSEEEAPGAAAADSKAPKDLFSLILRLPLGAGKAAARAREATTETGKEFWELMQSRTKAGKTGEGAYFDDLAEAEQQTLIETVKRVNQEKSACPFLFRVLSSQMPHSVKNTVLTKYENSRSESQGQKYSQWVEALLNVPFGIHKEPKHLAKTVLSSPTAVQAFFAEAEATLNKAVYGHDEAKAKLVQFFAQLTRRAMAPTPANGCKTANGLVLGIQGPPGNGKTTLIEKGVSEVLGLPFVSIPLGGATDASVLYGHSYTYEGSVWGQIADVLMKAKCMNPVIYLDELDKVSGTTKGNEIVHLLCNLTDPSQNHHFKDRYFGNIDIDLSKVTWVFSYNDRHAIHPVLKDRITEVQTKGFTLPQKQTIAKDFLVPSICEEIGMPLVEFPQDVVAYLVDRHTYEGGVRKIKELLFEVCRNLNKDDLCGKVALGAMGRGGRRKTTVTTPAFQVTRAMVDEYLQHKIPMLKEKVHTTGVAGRINGLYASSGTDMGGIIPIETKLVPSDNVFGLVLTGNLGKVMKESGTVAKTLAVHCLTPALRKQWETRWKEVKESVHVHCPEGAVSKDGPSAGTALTVAMLSLLSNNPIRPDVALTGEMNLSGEVTAIGGLRSKLYGAKSAGCRLALFPKDNLPDFEKIARESPDLLDATFEARPVATLGEVVALVMDTYDGLQMDAMGAPTGPVTAAGGTNKRRRTVPERGGAKRARGETGGSVNARATRHGYRTRAAAGRVV